MARLNVEMVREQIAKHRGNCAAIGRACGVTRPSVVKFVQRHPDLADALRDVRDALMDEAESALGAAVRRGEPWAVLFALKTLGKSRGYSERQELTGADGGPIETKRKITIEELSKIPLAERIDIVRGRRSASC